MTSVVPLVAHNAVSWWQRCRRTRYVKVSVARA